MLYFIPDEEGAEHIGHKPQGKAVDEVPHRPRQHHRQTGPPDGVAEHRPAAFKSSPRRARAFTRASGRP